MAERSNTSTGFGESFDDFGSLAQDIQRVNFLLHDSFSSRFKRQVAYVGGAISLFALACTSDGEVKASATNTPESGPTVVAEEARVSGSSAVESCPPNATVAERPFIAARDRVELKGGPRPDAAISASLNINDQFNSICYVDGPDGFGNQVRWYLAEDLGWMYPPGNLYDKPAVVVQPPPVSRPNPPPAETRPQPNPAPNPVPTEVARPLIPERVDLGSGSSILNRAGNVGVGIIREEDANYVQAMFAKYSEGRVINITIAREKPPQILSEGIKGSYWTFFGEGNVSKMDLTYVLVPTFDDFTIQDKTRLMLDMVFNRTWTFLAVYKFMEREKFEGHMLRNNPSTTGRFPIPTDMAKELSGLQGKFFYMDIGK